jgi:hypothetical protein
MRPWGFTGTPMPKDEPRAPNPPSGAVIDYWLPAATSGPVEITILDEQGRPVRHYTSAAHPEAPKILELRITPDWVQPPALPSAAAGLHRLVWDMHYAKPKGDIERGDDEEDAGVWAPPGRYEVELKVAGQTWRQPLELKPDPRIKPETVDYQAEFDLARRIEARRVVAAAALKEARELHKKLVDAQVKAAAPRRGQLKALDAELVAVTDIPTQSWAPGNLAQEPRSVTGLPWLNAQLASLARAADGADAAPSPDTRKGFEQTSALLDQTLAKWAPLKAKVEAEVGK